MRVSPVAYSLLCAWLALAAVIPFADQSLRKGQVIKQFEVYSVAESLSRDATGFLRTTLPCEGGIKWIHEPPVFSSVGGWAIRFAPRVPALAPMYGYFLLVLALWFFWSGEFRDLRRRACATLISAWAPVLLRYSIQFVPDLWAAAALVAGVAFLRRGRFWPAVGFFFLASAFKTLFAASALTLLAAHLFLVRRKGLLTGLTDRAAWTRFLPAAALMVATYLAWSMVLSVTGARGESSVGMVGDAFMGPLSLLADPLLYKRWFLWLFVKGAGPVLAIGALIHWRKARKAAEIDLLAWWFLGSIPYFLLIRQANIVHDYYSLGFSLALILGGVRFWVDRFFVSPKPSNSKGRLLAAGAMACSAALGLAGLASMEPVPMEPGRERPYFCGKELFGKFLGTYEKAEPAAGR